MQPLLHFCDFLLLQVREEVREMEKETKVDVACSRPEESQVNDQEEGDQKLNLMHSRRLIKMSHVDSLATSLKHRNVS